MQAAWLEWNIRFQFEKWSESKSNRCIDMKAMLSIASGDYLRSRWFWWVISWSYERFKLEKLMVSLLIGPLLISSKKCIVRPKWNYTSDIAIPRNLNWGLNWMVNYNFSGLYDRTGIQNLQMIRILKNKIKSQNLSKDGDIHCEGTDLNRSTVSCAKLVF